MGDIQDELRQSIAESVEQRHRKVCNEVAAIHGCKPELVDWLLFQADEAELRNMSPVDEPDAYLKMRCVLDDEYAIIMKKVSK